MANETPGTKTAICPQGHTVYYITGPHLGTVVKCLECGREVNGIRGQAVPHPIVPVGN